MNQREKIIITAAVVAALYGGFEYGLRPLLRPVAPPAPTVDLTAVTQQAAAAAQGRIPDPALTRLLAAGDLTWPATAYLSHPWDPEAPARVVDRETVQPLDPTRYVYSGFIAMDHRRLAIINGIDYGAGEIVDGYTVEEILPDRVLLSKDEERFAIIMQDDDL